MNCLPPYEAWKETCDTLHAHTQVLGKLAVVLAPHEPQLQHAALRLTARGWETLPLPAPNGSGALVVALDLQTHEAVVESSAGPQRRIALGPDRQVGAVTRDVLEAVGELAGPVEIDPTLARPVEGVRNQALAGTQDLEKKLIQHLKRRQETELGQIGRARTAVQPGGKPQERVLTVAPFLAREGPRLVEELVSAIEQWYATALEGASTPS